MQFSDYFLPSDLLTLPNNQENQYRKNFEALKTKKLKANSRPTSPPPIGGVVSNYFLLRNHPKLQSLFEETSKENKAYFQHIKRETPDDSDSVVINAEPFQNINSNEDVAEHKGNDNNDSNQDQEQSEVVQPGIAQVSQIFKKLVLLATCAEPKSFKNAFCVFVAQDKFLKCIIFPSTSLQV